MGQIIGSHPLAILIDEDDGLYNWTNSLFKHTYISRKKPYNPLSSLSICIKNSIIKSLFNNSPNIFRKPSFEQCCKLGMRKYRKPYKRFQKNGILKENIKFAVLKAPNLTYSYAEVYKVFPEVKVIYMLRDIRDVVSSIMLSKSQIMDNQLKLMLKSKILENRFPTEFSLLKQGNDIQPHIKLALIAMIKMSLSQEFKNTGIDVVNVRYEDLVSQPHIMISTILEKLCLPQSSECLLYHEVLQGWGPGQTQRSRPVDQKSIRKWTQYLTYQQQDEIWNVVGKFMETCGYNY